MKKTRFLPFILLLLSTGTISAQSAETGFLNRSISVDGLEYRYQVYVPYNYTAAEEWPVTLFLHGAGERGSNGLKQTQVGLGRAIRLNPERWQTLAVFPQVPVGESWQGVAGDVAMAALDVTIAEFSVDAGRLYLTGISLGGNGTWYLATTTLNDLRLWLQFVDSWILGADFLDSCQRLKTVLLPWQKTCPIPLCGLCMAMRMLSFLWSNLVKWLPH